MRVPRSYGFPPRLLPAWRSFKGVTDHSRPPSPEPRPHMSHPLGFHGHAAGSRIGLPDMQDGVPGMGDLPLIDDTVWAVELGGVSAHF